MLLCLIDLNGTLWDAWVVTLSDDSAIVRELVANESVEPFEDIAISRDKMVYQTEVIKNGTLCTSGGNNVEIIGWEAPFYKATDVVTYEKKYIHWSLMDMGVGF